jgi:type I restriction enzyme, S subunit
VSQQELPRGWALASVGDTGDYINGLAFKESDWSDQGLPIVRIQNLTNPQRPFNFTDQDVPRRARLDNGDILVSWSATLDVFEWRRGPAVVNQHIFKVVPDFRLVARLFLFYLLKHAIVEMRHSAHLHGSTMKHINRGPFLAHPIRLPPLAEQRRIVEAIETQLTRLDAAVAALERAQANLKRYRASVLKAAVEGRLVSMDALSKNREGIETQANHLAKNWPWVSLGNLLQEPLSNGRSVRDGSGPAVLRLTALKNGRIDLRERKNGAWSLADAEPYLVKRGDFLVSRRNGSKSLVGRGGLVDVDPDDVAFPDTLIRVRTDPDQIDPRYLQLAWNSPVLRGQIEVKARTTAGIYKINQDHMRQFELPLPDLLTQHRIVTEIDRRMTAADAIEGMIAASLKRSQRLRQSLLKLAFEGKLVPQDPSDEPASVLLERIRAEQSRVKSEPNRRLRKSSALQERLIP